MKNHIQLVGVAVPEKQIIRMEGVSDDDMLQVFARLSEDTDNTATLISRLSAIIAEKILRLQISDGLRLLVPVSALIERNLRYEKINPPTVDSPGALPEDTLAEIYGKLVDAVDPQLKLHEGIVLGDTALHKSAGFGTGRHIKKIMSDEEYQAYTRQMAFLGYLTALDSAERLNSKTVDSLNFIIRPIVERLVEVKNILKELLGIKDEKDEKSDLQKKLTGLIV